MSDREKRLEGLVEWWADWLVDAVAGATQNRALLRHDEVEDKALTGAILANGRKALTQCLKQALDQHGELTMSESVWRLPEVIHGKRIEVPHDDVAEAYNDGLHVAEGAARAALADDDAGDDQCPECGGTDKSCSYTPPQHREAGDALREILSDEGAMLGVADRAAKRQEEMMSGHRDALEAVYQHARALCYGQDWNKGTAAKNHRKPLVEAVNEVEPLPSMSAAHHSGLADDAAGGDSLKMVHIDHNGHRACPYCGAHTLLGNDGRTAKCVNCGEWCMLRPDTSPRHREAGDALREILSDEGAMLGVADRAAKRQEEMMSGHRDALEALDRIRDRRDKAYPEDFEIVRRHLTAPPTVPESIRRLPEKIERQARQHKLDAISADDRRDLMNARSHRCAAKALRDIAADMRKAIAQHSEPGRVPEATVDDMADRFLSWDLPPGFSPDGGIEFTPIANYWPTGTNLFCYEEAKEMVRYMLAAAPAPDADERGE